MDPKMDSGCVESEEDLEELYDISRPLLPEEVLGVIDQLICLEVSKFSENAIPGAVLTAMTDGLASRVSALADGFHQRLRGSTFYARPYEYT